MQPQSLSSLYKYVLPKFQPVLLLGFFPKSLMAFYNIMNKTSENTQTVTHFDRFKTLMHFQFLRNILVVMILCQGRTVAMFVNGQSDRSYNCKHGQG